MFGGKIVSSLIASSIALAVFAEPASHGSDVDLREGHGDGSALEHSAHGPPSGAPQDRPSEAVKLMPWLDLRRWPADKFREALTGQVVRLSTSHGKELHDTVLDVAELYLSQMMLDEAESVLGSMAGEASATSHRFVALRDALELLRGRAISEKASRSPLIDASRPDRDLWLTLDAVARGDAVALYRHAKGAFRALTYQSRPVARGLLPVLAEAAVELQLESVDAEAITLLEALGDPRSLGAARYLSGRRAELVGNEKTAVENYLLAADGMDIYATRARVALADMALKNGSRGALLAALDVLDEGVGNWRGDEYELAMLERLAEVDLELHRPEEALVAGGKILARFPRTPASQKARNWTSKTLEDLAAKGLDGELSLGEWVAVRRRLMPYFWSEPAFAHFSEQLGDAALKRGGTVLAVSEYQRVLAILEFQLASGSDDFDPQGIDVVRYKLATALLQSGKAEEAAEILKELKPVKGTPLAWKAMKLQAHVMAELGRTQELLEASVPKAGPEELRLMARARFDMEDWSGATRLYRKIWASFPEEFGPDDATYLMLSAYRMGDMETASRIADIFPKIARDTGISDLVREFLAQPEPIEPLTRRSASSRLERTDRALRLLGKSGL